MACHEPNKTTTDDQAERMFNRLAARAHRTGVLVEPLLNLDDSLMLRGRSCCRKYPPEGGSKKAYLLPFYLAS
jgi:hypothetical protein